MFKLNKQYAIENDQRGGFINESGKYIGTIESLIYYRTDKNGGSENVILNFISQNKQKARFFINTSYHGGTVNEGGIKMMSALLACLREGETGDPTLTPIKEYNPQTRQEETVQRPCFSKLHGKNLGIVVQMVHEEGRESPSPTLYTVFEATTEMTASEVLRQVSQPEQLAKIMAYIINRPLLDKRKYQTPPTATSASSIPPPPQARPTKPIQPQEDIDSDIPF